MAFSAVYVKGTTSAALGVSRRIEALPTRVVGPCALLYDIGYHRFDAVLVSPRQHLPVVPGARDNPERVITMTATLHGIMRPSIWFLYRESAQPTLQRSPDSTARQWASSPLTNHVCWALLASFWKCRRMFCLTRGIAFCRERTHRSRSTEESRSRYIGRQGSHKEMPAHLQVAAHGVDHTRQPGDCTRVYKRGAHCLIGLRISVLHLALRESKRQSIVANARRFDAHDRRYDVRCRLYRAGVQKHARVATTTERRSFVFLDDSEQRQACVVVKLECGDTTCLARHMLKSRA